MQYLLSQEELDTLNSKTICPHCDKNLSELANALQEVVSNWKPYTPESRELINGFKKVIASHDARLKEQMSKLKEPHLT